MEAIHPRALVVWLIASLVVVGALRNPFVALPVILAAAAIAGRRREGSPFRGFLVLGVIALLVRTSLFGLTGHGGRSVVFELPSLSLPTLLGGTTLGGPVTGEALAQGVAEGLRFIAVLACFGAFLSAAYTIDLLRMVPRFLFEAGLVVNIAVAYAPQLARSARDIREAQRMRGGRRSIAGTVVPALATALERSIALAESMDARGYGRTSGGSRSEARWRSLAAAAALAATAGGSLWAAGGPPIPSAAATILAGGVLATSLARLSGLVPRTQYRPRRWEPADRAVAAGAVAAAALAVILSARGLAERGFDPGSPLRLSLPSAPSSLVAGSLVLPAILVLRRRAEE